jgi:hypothetical protein
MYVWVRACACERARVCMCVRSAMLWLQTNLLGVLVFSDDLNLKLHQSLLRRRPQLVASINVQLAACDV